MTSLTILKGNVGRDPEVKQITNGTKVATYSIAVYRPNPKDKEKPLTDWFNVVAWGEQADMVANNLKKGTKILALGKLQTRSYQNKNGDTVTVTEFFQDEIYLALPKEKKTEVHESGSTIDDDSLPF